ncbi:MAG: hypothetical protein NC248_08850 [Bacteroides sp.]|nr:hypothetical protein [Bacteroides sp.]MCM1390410.1 hypothetical protein [Bacteroides sp.]
MSFFKSLARAFGFGSDENIVEESEIELSRDDSPSCVAGSCSCPNEPVEDINNGENRDFPVELFDSVLEIFNNTQPDFIRECIDRDAQRKYLYGVLGQSFRDCIDKCRERIEKDVESRASAERDSLVNEVARLKGELEKVVCHENRLNDERLSADRQKRALSDKIKTLEQQVMTLEAEKEQYKLEISSLLGKLEATGGVEKDNDHFVENEQEVAELKKRLSQSNFIAEQLKSEVDKLKKEIAETAELYKSRMAMSDKMLTDIRNTNRNSSKELEESKAEVEAIKLKYNEAVATIEKLNAELNEARATLDTADEVMAKMEQFDSILKKRDEKIEGMKADNSELLSKIAALESQNKRLASDLETNIMARASTENELKSTIEELSKKAAPAVEKPRRKRKTTPKISAIDETIDSTEWLVATPPENAPKVAPAVSDAEFGYQEPPKKSHPANDAQMSLF